MDDVISRQTAQRLFAKALTFKEKVGKLTWTTAEMKQYIAEFIEDLPPAQSDIKDEEAIAHLQSTGWMQNHDKEMYEMGMRKRLSDDSDSYDSMILAAQQWIPCSERLPYAEYGESPNVYCYCHDPERGGRWTQLLYYNGGVWCLPTGETFDYKVLAWYPLPNKPYKGEHDA